MKKKRFGVEQIAGVLKQAELFFSSEALCICIDVNNSKYSSLPTPQGVLRRLVQIETVPLDTKAAHPYRRAVLASRRIQIAI